MTFQNAPQMRTALKPKLSPIFIPSIQTLNVNIFYFEDSDKIIFLTKECISFTWRDEISGLRVVGCPRADFQHIISLFVWAGNVFILIPRNYCALVMI